MFRCFLCRRHCTRSAIGVQVCVSGELLRILAYAFSASEREPCRMSARTSGSVVSAITFGMTTGRGNGLDQSARAISSAGRSCRASRARSARSLAVRQCRRRDCIRMASRDRTRRRRLVGSRHAKADRDVPHIPSRCCRKLSTP